MKDRTLLVLEGRLGEGVQDGGHDVAGEDGEGAAAGGTEAAAGGVEDADLAAAAEAGGGAAAAVVAEIGADGVRDEVVAIHGGGAIDGVARAAEVAHIAVEFAAEAVESAVAARVEDIGHDMLSGLGVNPGAEQFDEF